MADAKILHGNAWGVPVSGSIVSVSGADVRDLLNAGAGLAKSVFSTGVKAVGLAAAAVATFALLRNREDDSFAWSTMASVETYAGFEEGFLNFNKLGLRKFAGVCLSKELVVDVDGHVFTIPIDYVRGYMPNHKMEKFGFLGLKQKHYTRVNLTLFDNSKYEGVLVSPNGFEFLTPLGPQVVPVTDSHFIHGCTVSEADKLRQQLTAFLEREGRTAEQLLGQSVFERFFVRQE